MEETRCSVQSPQQSTKILPRNTAHHRPLSHTNPIAPPPPPPPHNHQMCSSSDNNHGNIKKRKLGHVGLLNSAYFKILLLVQQLRPHFMEALRTPDFRNCKAAYEIRKRMKVMMDVYKQMQTEGNPMGNRENRSVCQTLSGEKKLEKGQSDGLRHGGKVHSLPRHVRNKSSGMELPPSPASSGKPFVDGRPPLSYIVGGSTFTRNFITFANRNPPVYYGTTKETYRRSHYKNN